jgi:putative ABC transport system permease protein
MAVAAGREWLTSLLVRPNGSAASMLTSIRTAVAEIDTELVPYNVMTLDDRLNLGLAINRAGAIVAGAMGALAFALGCLGIYGTMAFLVQQRRREIGIRVALGAAPRQVTALILRQGFTWTGSGLLIGLVTAWAAGFGLRHFLQGIDAADPVAFLVTPLVLGVSACGACYAPARQALRVNALETLKTE